MAMTERKIRIHGQRATFFVNGARRGDGMLLLYPDKLTAVVTRSVRTWIYARLASRLPGGLVPGVPHDRVGILALWYLPAWWVWQAVDTSRAARKAAAGGDGVIAVPLDQVTSVRCRKDGKAATWLGITKLTVTTADGTEYLFDGLMQQWESRLADALTARGREVYVESETVTVKPWATPGDI